MDEHEIAETVEIRPIKHDRWSVLVLGLNWATQVFDTTAQTLEQFTIMAAQHANHKKYEEKFDKIVENYDG